MAGSGHSEAQRSLCRNGEGTWALDVLRDISYSYGMPIRSFSSQFEDTGQAQRDVDDDAPQGLRQELIDLFYQVCSRDPGFTAQHFHQVITQSLGFQPAGNPYGGYRYAASRDIQRAEWARVYDLISRLWDEVPEELRREYLAGVNRILAAYRIAWELGTDGQLRRILPPIIQDQIEIAFRELSQPRFESALQLFRDALIAYNDRPQRGRDTCANIMDALEAVAKEVFEMPAATFGNVLAEARNRQEMAAETISVLQKLYDMANSHFRHGMTTPFALNNAEVDFVYLSCVAGMLLFIRL